MLCTYINTQAVIKVELTLLPYWLILDYFDNHTVFMALSFQMTWWTFWENLSVVNNTSIKQFITIYWLTSIYKIGTLLSMIFFQTSVHIDYTKGYLLINQIKIYFKNARRFRSDYAWLISSSPDLEIKRGRISNVCVIQLVLVYKMSCMLSL